MFNFRQYASDTSGMAVIEAAMVFPFLVTAGFASMDASYMVLQSHKMESSLSAAANYLAQTTVPEDFETRAKRLATTGQIQSGGTSIIPFWTETDITITYKAVANTPINDGLSYRGGDQIKVVQISSTLNYEGFGFLKALNGGHIAVGAKSEARLTGRRS